MAQRCRVHVKQLYEMLQEDSEDKRMEAADVIHSLIEDIVLTPVDSRMEIDVRGNLAGILTLSLQTKKSPPEGRGHRN